MNYNLQEMQGIHQRWSQSGLSRKAFSDTAVASFEVHFLTQ